ncbi:MAG: hypothetical protein GF317_02700 [Candidatus Lokiarchaeota archaeon]|nr:hypothetical protein [Candidatus Lokiarchaeota archaeon]MBD3198816.1 hypothetical protein [Candidatus Lokiarchaeota archaeon]
MKSENNMPHVILSKETFRNIITHTLRFKNRNNEGGIKVFGVCLGSIKNNTIQVVNAIPISHKVIETVQLDEKTIEIFKKIEKQYEEQNLGVVGWYLSHPFEELEWTVSDKENHLKIQKESWSNNFHLILDNRNIQKENEFGIKIFRLKDPSKGISSETEELNFEIEPPKTLNFFKWVQKFVEDYHKKDPVLIKEVQELEKSEKETAPRDLQEIPLTEIETNEKSVFSSELTEVSSEFHNIVDNLFKLELTPWKENFKYSALSGMDKLLESLINIKENLSNGMNIIQNWFKKELDNTLESFGNSATSYIDSRVIEQDKLEKDIQTEQELLLEETSQNINSNLEEYHNQIMEKMNKIDQNLEEFSSKHGEYDQRIISLSEIIGKNEDIIGNLVESYETDLKNSENYLIDIIKEKKDSLIPRLKKLEENQTHILERITEMQKMIIKLRNL